MLLRRFLSHIGCFYCPEGHKSSFHFAEEGGEEALGLDLNIRSRLQEMTIFIVFHTSMKADEISCIADTNNTQ